MKIKCSFCDCAIEATSETCPHCGGINDKAAMYANQHERNMLAKEQARKEAFESGARVREKAKKIVFAVYGTIAVLIIIPFIVGIFLAINNNAQRERERVERKRIEQEQQQEEQRLQEEQEMEMKAYDEEEVAVTGINEIALKDRYYSLQVTDVVPYELNYDHNKMYWSESVTDDPVLLDNEHRIAIHLNLKNYQDRISIYSNPSGLVKLFIEDENANSIVIQDEKYLNGSSSDNYYSGGMMISDTEVFSDNYGKSLEKNQTMGWWVPIVVNEKSQKIILHFDYNMSITIDNPYAK